MPFFFGLYVMLSVDSSSSCLCPTCPPERSRSTIADKVDLVKDAPWLPRPVFAPSIARSSYVPAALPGPCVFPMAPSLKLTSTLDSLRSTVTTDLQSHITTLKPPRANASLSTLSPSSPASVVLLGCAISPPSPSSSPLTSTLSSLPPSPRDFPSPHASTFFIVSLRLCLYITTTSVMMSPSLDTWLSSEDVAQVSTAH